jgi:hypothetical protein
MLEQTGKSENISLVVTQRIKPAAAFMRDYDDFRASAEFYRPARAFLHVDREPGLLKKGCAAHSLAQLFYFFSFHGFPDRLRSFLNLTPRIIGGTPSGRREEQRGQGRGRQGATLHRPQRSFPCRRQLASGSQVGFGRLNAPPTDGTRE